MKYKLTVIVLAVTVTAMCFLSGCTKKTAQTEEEQAQETVTVTPTPTVVNTATPIPLQIGTTASGIKVEQKMQKYQVVIGANIRADASGDSEWKGSLFGGEILQGTGVCENGWIQITYNEEACYVTGGCLEEVDDGIVEEVVTGTVTPTPTETPEATYGATITATVTPPSLEPTVSVTDWAQHTSSKWESTSGGAVSCTVHIFSIAGNEAVLRFSVYDSENPELKAEVKNCNGKIENGVLNFAFTDDQGNTGVGNMQIEDEDTLSITTIITDPNPEAAYQSEIMTDLKEIE